MPSGVIKASVLVVLFLLVSLNFFPNIQIHSTIAAEEQGFVEIQSEVCGVSDSSTKTVKLTQEEYCLFQQYISEFQSRINTTTTLEEAIPLYKNLAVKLAEFNLLPRGITVQRAQALMLRSLRTYQPMNTSASIFENWSDAGYNVGCLVSGEVHQVVSYFAPVILPFATAYIALFLFILVRLGVFHFVNQYIIPDWYWQWHSRPEPLLVQLLYPISEKIDDFINHYLYTASNNPFALCTRIHFVKDQGTGRIRTLGLLGEKQWDGDLTGIIPPFHDAVIGFSGFKFANVGEDSFFFIGSALAVGVGYRKP
ncbi:MAG: hypothetical protein JXA00_04520 [Candidatus Thermoplasmatota archaeon]|nr:hypothetical protein [Candidatus Thermoplasmatota archaeon]